MGNYNRIFRFLRAYVIIPQHSLQFHQNQYSLSSTFASGNKTALITKNTTVTKKVTGLTAKKKYYVRVRTYKTVGSTKYYSAWSKALAVTTKA